MINKSIQNTEKYKLLLTQQLHNDISGISLEVCSIDTTHYRNCLLCSSSKQLHTCIGKIQQYSGQLITYFQIIQTAFYYYVLALLKATSSRHNNSSRSGIEAKSVSLNKVKYILAKSCW